MCCGRGCRESRTLLRFPGVINRDFADVKTTMAGMGYAVMGTALRSGSNRATEAAMAAMASPLLEAGAIDGARGILINITGSSSLKLSEVNEASMIIQNAAHEDANIIFGAVLDETMGDDVKITVIATGFRQQEMPERRERMLAETTMPGSRYDVPVQARVPMQRFPVNREEAPRLEQPMARAPGREASGGVPEVRSREAAAQAPAVRIAPAAATEPVSSVRQETERASSPKELMPVPASVFDDDFFRSGLSRGGADGKSGR